MGKSSCVVTHVVVVVVVFVQENKKKIHCKKRAMDTAPSPPNLTQQGAGTAETAYWKPQPERTMPVPVPVWFPRNRRDAKSLQTVMFFLRRPLMSGTGKSYVGRRHSDAVSQALMAISTLHETVAKPAPELCEDRLHAYWRVLESELRRRLGRPAPREVAGNRRARGTPPAATVVSAALVTLCEFFCSRTMFSDFIADASASGEDTDGEGTALRPMGNGVAHMYSVRTWMLCIKRLLATTPQLYTLDDIENWVVATPKSFLFGDADADADEASVPAAELTCAQPPAPVDDSSHGDWREVLPPPNVPQVGAAVPATQRHDTDATQEMTLRAAMLAETQEEA